MKLIKFDATTASGFKTGESTIRFHTSGMITLSKTFVIKSGLKEGDKVFVAQDEETPSDWYLVPDGENGFPLRSYKGNDGLAFNNAYTAKSIIEFLEIKTKSVAFKLCTDPVELEEEENAGGGVLYSILTSTAKYAELEEA